MKNIWLVILALLVVGGAAWYFNANYLNKVPSNALSENTLTGNSNSENNANEILVFVAPDGKIKTVNLEGKISAQDKPTNDWPNPIFSSNGQNQALVEFSNAEINFGYSLYVANKNGGDKKKIAQNEEEISSPRWSVDDLTIYYLQDNGDKIALMKAEIASGQPQEILRVDGFISDLIVIDGNHIAYLLRADDQSGTIGDIIVVSTDGKNKTVLTKGIKILGWLP